MPRVRDPKRTRRKILEASYREFYRHGFQGGSINRIVDAAGITKGALFHHFTGKNELGYAVLDELMDSSEDDPPAARQPGSLPKVDESVDSGFIDDLLGDSDEGRKE